jgi:nucleotide-binding universal stress UspA family protein
VANDRDATIHYEAVEGKPADTLAQKARSENVNLIVVGPRGLGPIHAAVGSVTLRLLAQAPCPVVVVPATGHSS